MYTLVSKVSVYDITVNEQSAAKQKRLTNT